MDTCLDVLLLAKLGAKFIYWRKDIRLLLKHHPKQLFLSCLCIHFYLLCFYFIVLKFMQSLHSFVLTFEIDHQVLHLYCWFSFNLLAICSDSSKFILPFLLGYKHTISSLYQSNDWLRRLCLEFLKKKITMHLVCGCT